MNLVVCSEHSVAVDLLTEGGFALDVGARHFSFSNDMLARGIKPIAMEPDPTCNDEVPVGCRLLKRGLGPASWRGQRLFETGVDGGTGCHIVNPAFPTRGDAQVGVEFVTLEDVMELTGIKEWEVVKLDCEGAEYMILPDWPGPVAKQITVEFHEHTMPNVPSYIKTLERISQWYTTVKLDRTRQHGLPNGNYWDALFIRKDLL